MEKEKVKKFALKFYDMRIQLLRIENEGDLHSSQIAKKVELIIDECVDMLEEKEYDN
jgi:hypothetical protein